MLYVEKEEKSSYAESIRNIKVNIKYSFIDYEKKIMLVTSTEQGDGKSTIASNLALSLSQDNKKVILVDCDLRRPSIYSIFRISNQVGLMDYLIGESTIENVVSRYSNKLDILTTGPLPNKPTEVLSSRKFDELLSNLKVKYDYIILDTTPLGAVADAQVLVAKADGVVLVVRHEKTRREKLSASKKNIDIVGGKLIGVVVNRKKFSKNLYY